MSRSTARTIYGSTAAKGVSSRRRAVEFSRLNTIKQSGKVFAAVRHPVGLRSLVAFLQSACVLLVSRLLSGVLIMSNRARSPRNASKNAFFSRNLFLVIAILGISAMATLAAFGPQALGLQRLLTPILSGTAPSENAVLMASRDTEPIGPSPMLPTSGSLITARSGHTATKLDDGRVLVVGGESTGANEIYDPTSGTSGSTGSLSVPRSGHTATRLNDGRVLIAGGSGDASTEIFDPVSGTFSAGPAMTTARSGHTATLLGNGNVFVAGGGSDTAEIFDGTAFTAVASAMTAVRTNASAIRMNDGRVFLAGGDGLGSAEIYDPASGTFSNVGNAMAMARSRALLRVLPDGKIQIIGGNSDGSMEVYDPAIDSIGAFAHVVPESDPCANLINYVLKAETRAALIFSGSSTPERNRSGHTITELGSTALLIGGSDGSGATNTVTEFQSSTATLTTDLLDYRPGETVNISGTGFEPGETVRVMIHEDPHTPQERGFDAATDSNGNFSGTYVVQDYDLNMKFVVGARGLTSGNTAQTVFTDAPRINATVAVGAQSAPLTFGTAGSATFSVLATRSANGTVNGTTSITAGLPVGVTATFSTPNPWTANGGTAFPSTTITLTTTAAAAAGTYPFNVRVADGSDIGSGTGTLTIGAANQAINVSTAAPANAVFGQTFNVAATGGGSGNPVVIATSGSCSGSGNGSATITITAPTGTCTVTYNQAGNSNYNPATQVLNTTTAAKANTTTTVTSDHANPLAWTQISPTGTGPSTSTCAQSTVSDGAGRLIV